MISGHTAAKAGISVTFPYSWPSVKKRGKGNNIFASTILDVIHILFYFILFSKYREEKSSGIIVAEDYSIGFEFKYQ